MPLVVLLLYGHLVGIQIHFSHSHILSFSTLWHNLDYERHLGVLLDLQVLFSLMELSVVVAILSILGSLGITNISKWMKLAQIDEAMSVLNMSLVECLSSTRSGTDPATISPPADVIDNKL